MSRGALAMRVFFFSLVRTRLKYLNRETAVSREREVNCLGTVTERRVKNVPHRACKNNRPRIPDAHAMPPRVPRLRRDDSKQIV